MKKGDLLRAVHIKFWAKEEVTIMQALFALEFKPFLHPPSSIVKN